MPEQPLLPLSAKSSTSTTGFVLFFVLIWSVTADEAPGPLSSEPLDSRKPRLCRQRKKNDLASPPLIKPMGYNGVISVMAESQFKTLLQILCKIPEAGLIDN